jgi:hypothetical protein
MSDDGQIPMFPESSAVSVEQRESLRPRRRGRPRFRATSKPSPVSVMLTPELEAALEGVPNRSEFIREAIAEKLARDTNP